MATTLADDWGNLAKSVGDIGKTEWNQQLGLATLLETQRSNDSVIRSRDIETQRNKLILDEAQKKQEFSRRPVTPEILFQTFNSPDFTESSGLQSATFIQGALDVLGVKIPKNNTDTKQALIKSDGSTFTLGDLKNVMPFFSSYVTATSDPFEALTNNITKTKRDLGSTTPGPLLSPEEHKGFSQDPEKKDLITKYNEAINRHGQYSKPENQAMLLNQQQNLLTKMEGVAELVGGDSASLKTKKKDIQDRIKKIEEDLVKKGNMIQVTQSMSDASGIPVGTLLPASETAQVGGVVGAGLRQITQNQNAVTVANIQQAGAKERELIQQGGANTRQIAASENEKTTVIKNTYLSNRNVGIPEKVIAQFEKSRDIAGKIKITTEEGGKRIEKILTTSEEEQYKDNQIKKIQMGYDQNTFDTLGPKGWAKVMGGEPPAYVSKAPPQIRQEYGQKKDMLKEAIKTLPEGEFSKNSAQILKSIWDGVNTGDPKKIESARQNFSNLENSIKTFQETLKKDINPKIKGMAKQGMFGLQYMNPNTTNPTFRQYPSIPQY